MSDRLSGFTLCRLFGQIRVRVLGKGFPWDSPKAANGTAATMADAINEEPGARADVEPTIELLFHRAQDGKAGSESAKVLRDPSFAFGAWCSQWTALREELHGLAPEAPKQPDKTLSFEARAAQGQRSRAHEARAERILGEHSPKQAHEDPRARWGAREAAK